MIAVCGRTAFHLGGPRGDRLYRSEDAGPFETVADLGWDSSIQAAPQRRMLLTEDALFVLEPLEGPLLGPGLRARRFDAATGEEQGAETGDVESEEASLGFRAEEEPGERMRLHRFGVDPKTGRPLIWQRVQERGPLLKAREHCSGIPLKTNRTWWYPFRQEGLWSDGPSGTEFRPGDAQAPSLIDGKCVVPAVRRRQLGVWIEGDWQGLSAGRAFPGWRYPLAPTALGWADGIVLLRRDGGPLPAGASGLKGETAPRVGPPPELPRGIYSALLSLGKDGYALEEQAGPRLVPLHSSL